jgi:hypothetical protein
LAACWVFQRTLTRFFIAAYGRLQGKAVLLVGRHRALIELARIVPLEVRIAGVAEVPFEARQVACC